MEIKLLDEKKDVELLREAWSWSDASARWFREANDAWKETFEDFLKSAKDEMLFGVYAEELTAVIRLIPAGGQIYVIHLYAKRKTPLEVLVSAGNTLKEYLYNKGVNGFFGWIPTRNRSIIRLYEMLGFRFSGYRQYKPGESGRVFEWRQMISHKNIEQNA